MNSPIVIQICLGYEHFNSKSRQLTKPILLDTNECRSDNNPCHPNATCINTIGSYTCKCNRGFYGDGTSTCKGTLGLIIIDVFEFLNKLNYDILHQPAWKRLKENHALTVVFTIDNYVFHLCVQGMIGSK